MNKSQVFLTGIVDAAIGIPRVIILIAVFIILFILLRMLIELRCRYFKFMLIDVDLFGSNHMGIFVVSVMRTNCHFLHSRHIGKGCEMPVLFRDGC